MRLRGMESRAGPLYQVERGGCLDVAMHAPTIAVILQENSGVRGCVPEKHPDQVPAGMFRHNVSGETFYNIPRGDRGNGWIATAPHRDMERLKAVAQGKENFRNVTRLCKHIQDMYNILVPSFAIESAIVEYAERNYWYGDLYLDFRVVLKTLIKAFRGGVIPDPFDNQNNLIAGVGSLAWYAERLEKIIAGMDECADWPRQDEVRERIYELLENR
ncbi:hypothetical protein [Methanoculleus bourgensis]|jgi:hypothetical protein|nr:hypothetical protein [Methanoculleus bourgensis]